jgi:predicted alpha/beta superfamily hydrolase
MIALAVLLYRSLRVASLAALLVAVPALAGGDRDLAAQLVLIQFHSTIFANDRTIRILLPPGYAQHDRASRSYPVLYLNDGQDLFDPNLSTFYNGGSYLLKDRMQALYAENAVRPMIIVGIDNAGHGLRPNEYLPWPDTTLRPWMPHPHGSLYPAFMTQEIMPFIQARFRVLTDVADTGVGGASYGALAAIYLVTQRPGRFGRLLVESPSVYPNDYALIGVVNSARSLPSRISIGAGTNEDGHSICIPRHSPQPELLDVWRLTDALMRRQRESSSLRLTVIDCARHRNADFGARFPGAVEFLFGQS